MEKYKLLLAEVGSLLKAKGFTKKRDTFYLFRENNWGLINFQKSRGSSARDVSFTINLGVTSTALRKTLQDLNDVNDRPDIEDCHWRKRIGFLLPKNQDYWWIVDDSTPLEVLKQEISTIISSLAIPELERHIADESLKREWLSGIAEGATELQRYIYLTTLLKLYKDGRLPNIIDELISFSKGKSYEYTAKEHIKELESYGK